MQRHVAVERYDDEKQGVEDFIHIHIPQWRFESIQSLYQGVLKIVQLMEYQYLRDAIDIHAYEFAMFNQFRIWQAYWITMDRTKYIWYFDIV
jgi:hypothetical protein